jgi:hypothetical protein
MEDYEFIKYQYGYPMGQNFWEIEGYEGDPSEYDVFIKPSGKVIYENGVSVIRQNKSKSGIFVFTIDGQLRMGKKVHHSDLTHGEPVLCAGEYKLDEKGILKELTNKSGHFVPKISCLDQVIEYILFFADIEIEIKEYNPTNLRKQLLPIKKRSVI